MAVSVFLLQGLCVRVIPPTRAPSDRSVYWHRAPRLRSEVRDVFSIRLLVEKSCFIYWPPGRVGRCIVRPGGKGGRGGYSMVGQYTNYTDGNPTVFSYLWHS